MTVVALISGGDVGRRLSGRLNAVVTADTIASYGGVIHESDHAPVRRNVTVGAFTRRRHMARWL